MLNSSCYRECWSDCLFTWCFSNFHGHLYKIPEKILPKFSTSWMLEKDPPTAKKRLANLILHLRWLWLLRNLPHQLGSTPPPGNKGKWSFLGSPYYNHYNHGGTGWLGGIHERWFHMVAMISIRPKTRFILKEFVTLMKPGCCRSQRTWRWQTMRAATRLRRKNLDHHFLKGFEKCIV